MQKLHSYNTTHIHTIYLFKHTLLERGRLEATICLLIAAAIGIVASLRIIALQFRSTLKFPSVQFYQFYSILVVLTIIVAQKI